MKSRNKSNFYLAFSGFILVTLVACSNSADTTPPSPAIASSHEIATQAGFTILEAGGNAFDAAIAVASTLGVVEPAFSGLGGGSFWLLYSSEQDEYTFIDAREKAPLLAHETLFLDDDGNIIEGASLTSLLASAIPGTPAAYDYIANHFGRLSLHDSLIPAITHAREGFPVDSEYRRAARNWLEQLQAYPQTASIFLRDNKIPKIGRNIKQTDLADTLETLAHKGRDGFYQGEIAEKMVNAVRNNGGIWQLEDLTNYEVAIRNPLIAEYDDITIITAPPPSAGGVTLLTIMNILANFNKDKMEPAIQKHLLVEIMRRAYYNRSQFLGDPDYVEVPISTLLSDTMAEDFANTIRLDKASPSKELADSFPQPKLLKNTTSSSHDLNFSIIPWPVPFGYLTAGSKPESENTTHFSIIDQEGNIASVTLSLNYFFGTGFVVEGTGILLNNQMDDFTTKSGKPNAFGLVDSEQNTIEPGKRPLSSMTPTIVEGPLGIAVLGSPGGSKIINTVFLGVLDYLKGQKPDFWVKRKRFHHQYLPDRIYYETGAFTEEEILTLEAMGHEFYEDSSIGALNALLWDKNNNIIYSASDPRRVVFLPTP